MERPRSRASSRIDRRFGNQGNEGHRLGCGLPPAGRLLRLPADRPRCRQRVLYWNSCGPGDVRTPRVRARSSLSSRCRAGRSITDSDTCTAGSAATRPRSGRGIDRQLEDCLAIAGKRGWRARDWYSDYDRSAWSELGDRPDFDRRKKRGWRSHKDRYPLRVQVNLLATVLTTDAPEKSHRNLRIILSEAGLDPLSVTAPCHSDSYGVHGDGRGDQTDRKVQHRSRTRGVGRPCGAGSFCLAMPRQRSWCPTARPCWRQSSATLR